MQDTCERTQAASVDHPMIARRGVTTLSCSFEFDAFSPELRMAPPSENAPNSAGLKPVDKPSLQVLLVDDHSIIRKGLKRILSGEFKHATFGEAANADQALEAIMRQTWDLVLLDFTMPGRSGAEVLEQMTKARPDVRVLVCSMHPEEQYAVPMLKAGAAGYITKNSTSQELVNAAKKVLAGQKYVSATLAESMIARLNHSGPGPAHETLSARELQVMCLLATGHSIKEIAFQLCLSIKTINTYRTRLMKKLGLTTNYAIIHYALVNRLVE
jgi:DNA-binding NarL/FixJ family response regulator